jgi:hypothetical protein
MTPSELCLVNPRRTAVWSKLYTRMSGAIGRLYCYSFHSAISHPVNGKYRCWRCLREFELGW